MIIRVYEPSAVFGDGTDKYGDYKCDNYQVYNGMLHIMCYGKTDLFIPLGSMKMFEKLSAEKEIALTEQEILCLNPASPN